MLSVLSSSSESTVVNRQQCNDIFVLMMLMEVHMTILVTTVTPIHPVYPDPYRGLLKSYLKVVTPAQLPALGGLPTTIVDEAVFLHFIFYFNYYHVFAEYAPTLHNVVCKYWGKCR